MLWRKFVQRHERLQNRKQREASFKSAPLPVYVPAMIHCARDGGDVFNLPAMITNNGAKKGTVLSMTLDVENLDLEAERKTATFHGNFRNATQAMQSREWQAAISKPYAATKRSEKNVPDPGTAADQGNGKEDNSETGRPAAQ